MTKTSNPLRIVLEDVLSGSGFARKGDTWYRRTDEAVEVVNLQKSQYGQQYYLNYAIWLLPLGDATFPKEVNCHIRLRMDAIASSRERLARLLDLEADIPEVERKAALTAVLTDEFLPFAAGNRVIADVGARLKAGQLSKAMVTAAAKQLLTH